MRLRHPSPGVTLVELMVAVAVLAVLSMLAVPSFSDFFDRARVRGAADDVVSLISNARAEGVRNDLDVNVAFSGSGEDWCVGGNAAPAPTGGAEAGVAGECDCADDAPQCRIAGARPIVQSSAYPGVRIGALPTPMTFDKTMGVLGDMDARAITLTSPKGKYTLAVRINLLGQAQACVPADAPNVSGILRCD